MDTSTRLNYILGTLDGKVELTPEEAAETFDWLMAKIKPLLTYLTLDTFASIVKAGTEGISLCIPERDALMRENAVSYAAPLTGDERIFLLEDFGPVNQKLPLIKYDWVFVSRDGSLVRVTCEFQCLDPDGTQPDLKERYRLLSAVGRPTDKSEVHDLLAQEPWRAMSMVRSLASHLEFHVIDQARKRLAGLEGLHDNLNGALTRLGAYVQSLP